MNVYGFNRSIALGVIIALAQAAEPTGTLTLACQGAVTIKAFGGRFTEDRPDPISMGLVVDFTNRTVQGASRWGPYLFDDQLQITDLTERTVVFSAFSKFLGMDIRGFMDRVTGDVGMVATPKETGGAYEYSLKCKPTQRMF